MAFRVLRFCGQISHLKRFNNPELRIVNIGIKSQLLSPQLPIKCPQRTTSFFTKKSSEELWKSVISVSNAGKRRGRGKRGSAGKGHMNLNAGQKIGVGKHRVLWPGLSTPVIQGKSLIYQHRLPDDPEHQENIVKLRERVKKSTRVRLHPLDRGWTSAKMGGRKIGPPDPVGEDTFEGFNTIILEQKVVGHMTGNLGRLRIFSVFVVTGNYNGLVGIALRKSSDIYTSLRNARNGAGKKLFYIKRYNDHTVYHDFFCQYSNTKVYVTQKNPGYGLMCQRVIKAICEIVGIKDIHVKIEGSTNPQSIAKAFLIGLLRQKTHQQLSEEKKLHLVEFRKENGYFPTVVASPSVVRQDSEIPSTETMDFTQYVMDGKVVLKKKKSPAFYTRLKSYEKHLKKAEKLRNKDEVRLNLRAEYGDIRSFLTEKYPEAIPQLWKKKQKEPELQEEE